MNAKKRYEKETGATATRFSITIKNGEAIEMYDINYVTWLENKLEYQAEELLAVLTQIHKMERKLDAVMEALNFKLQ